MSKRVRFWNPTRYPVCDAILTRRFTDVNESHGSPKLQPFEPTSNRKSVQFNLSPYVQSTQSSAEHSPRSLLDSDESDQSRLDGQSERRSGQGHGNMNASSNESHEKNGDSNGRPQQQRSHGDTGSASIREARGHRNEDSESVEMLPDRFDAEGRKLSGRDDEPLATGLLRGQGIAGRWFSSYAGDLIGSGSSSGQGRRNR